MSTAPRSASGPGLVDLEKELVCSICTELLYQPLTLLDCLHTFCGSCLREWFATQGSRSRSSRSRFTCPSCRAVVRETRPNATVTTLLDMVLAANPDRAKSTTEKEEIAQRYKPGDSAFPTDTQLDGSVDSDEDDQRLLERVRAQSLQESRAAQARGASYRSRQSSTNRHRENNESDSRSRRRNERNEEDRAARRRAERRADNTSTDRTRQIEHQSSLRSLLSLSDAETMEEEILRQILEEGLLDDIDMENLGPRQEEELSERIAEAYRRRHRLRSRSQQRQETRETSHTSSPRPRARSQSAQRPSATPAARESSNHPPVSRPHLLEPLVPRSGQSSHQRRLSDQGSNRRRTSPVPVNPASSSDVALRPAARSSSDMTAERTRNSQAGRARTTEARPTRTRASTESEQSITNIWTAGARERATRPLTSSPTTTNSPVLRSVHNSIPPRPGQGASASTTSLVSPSLAPGVTPNGRSRPSSSRSNASSSPSASYIEPSVACDRCGKQNIQYELYKKCSHCKGGKYHLCLQCYHLGLGCLQWAGFGLTAESFDKRLVAPTTRATPTREIPHVLLSFKYNRPSETARRVVNEDKQMTSDDPSKRLQTGLFCDICQSTANKCFWKCNDCNEGDWGFCNRCVNQGKCCTHALLPICRITPEDRSDPPSSTSPDTPPDNTSNDSEILKILSFSTNCDICTSPILASTTRFHCLECNDGDYDICANCYLKLGATGKISKENGHNGWRRCPKGHRMIVIGFEDHEEGQRRVIVRDLVGGRALKDEHVQPPTSSPQTHPPGNVPSPEVGLGDWSWKDGAERRKKASRVRTSFTNSNNHTNSPDGSPTTPTQSTPIPNRRFPPDGGVGLTVHALWSWYPDAGVEDELMFPRGAEITEAENINDDWFWGCYAGRTGLFPGKHVRVVSEIAQ